MNLFKCFLFFQVSEDQIDRTKRDTQIEPCKQKLNCEAKYQGQLIV